MNQYEDHTYNKAKDYTLWNLAQTKLGNGNFWKQFQIESPRGSGKYVQIPDTNPAYVYKDGDKLKIPLNSPTSTVPTSIQSGWHLCKKCAGLFYQSTSINDPCQGGGKHEFDAADHKLTKTATWNDIPAQGADQQVNWAYCTRCHVLFDASDKEHNWCYPPQPKKTHVSPTGNASGHYILQMVPTDQAKAFYKCSKCGGLFSKQGDNVNRASKCNAGGAHQTTPGFYYLVS